MLLGSFVGWVRLVQLQGTYRPIRSLLLEVLGPSLSAILTQHRSLRACMEAAFIVTYRLPRPNNPLTASCGMSTHLARTLRRVTLLSPIGPNALVLMRRAILLWLTLRVLRVPRIPLAKRSLVAGVVISFPTPEQMARQAAPLSLRALWPKQGGTGSLFIVLRTLV